MKKVILAEQDIILVFRRRVISDAISFKSLSTSEKNQFVRNMAKNYGIIKIKLTGHVFLRNITNNKRFNISPFNFQWFTNFFCLEFGPINCINW